MKSGYESLIWVNDKDGKEYVCDINAIAKGKSFDRAAFPQVDLNHFLKGQL